MGMSWAVLEPEASVGDDGSKCGYGWNECKKLVNNI
jgi:hypothetical protein